MSVCSCSPGYREEFWMKCECVFMRSGSCGRKEEGVEEVVRSCVCIYRGVQQT